MPALICGSLAFDTITTFGGRFAEQILPEQVHILNVERDEDVLVYLCHVAERLIFGRKLNERIDNVCAPKKEAVQLARQKLVSAFIKFFS